MGLVRALVICAVLGLTSGKLHDSRFSSKDTLAKAVGDNVLFNISRDPAPYTELSWEFWQRSLTIISVLNGVNTTNPEYLDRITLFEDGSLELRNLTESDSGAYQVSIKSTEASQFSDVFILYVQRPFSDVQLSASATDLIEWNYVTLNCSASGSDLDFAWYNQSHYIGSLFQELTLFVNRYDSGPYRCEAYNKINRVSSEWLNLTISYGPGVTLTAFPMQHTYDEGSTVTLTCTVDSKPEAEISWLYDGGLTPFNGTELVLKDLTYKQKGMYRCKAYNRKTDKTYYQTMYIPVKYKPDDNGLPPYAILGIVLGISYGGLIIGALTWYIIQRKKARAR